MAKKFNKKSKKNKPKLEQKSPVVKSVVIPRTLNLRKAQLALEAYRSNVSNMFTSNDNTLTTEGFVRSFSSTGYIGDVEKCLTMYSQDGLLAGLIDSIANNANTDINFDLPSGSESEEDIWKTFRRLLNNDIRNTLAGTSMLHKQMFLSMLKTGMTVPDFEWNTVKIGRKTYELPTKIITYPVMSVKLQSDLVNFNNEEVLVNVSKEYYKSTMNTREADVAYRNMFVDFGNDQMAMKRKNAFAIKYNFDNNNSTIYPIPMLRRSFQAIALRQKHMDADITTLEFIINKIIQIKVGDKDNPPKANQVDENGQILYGDVEMAQSLFNDMDEVVETIATPYFYEIKIIMPETTVLLDQKKYVQSTFDIYANFGILLDPSSNSNSVQFEKLNLANYEKMIIDLQKHVSGWYTWLITQIIKRNEGKIKHIPKVSFDKPDVYDKDFLKQLKELYAMGGVSLTTLLDKYGLDYDMETQKLIKQHEDEEKNEGLLSPRATFKQISTTDESTSISSRTDNGGQNNKNKIEGSKGDVDND